MKSEYLHLTQELGIKDPRYLGEFYKALDSQLFLVF